MMENSQRELRLRKSCIYVLFNDAVGSKNYITLNDKMSNESEKIWREGVVALFKILSRNLHRWTE
jgi:hypothetical protein